MKYLTSPRASRLRMGGPERGWGSLSDPSPLQNFYKVGKSDSVLWSGRHVGNSGYIKIPNAPEWSQTSKLTIEKAVSDMQGVYPYISRLVTL